MECHYNSKIIFFRYLNNIKKIFIIAIVILPFLFLFLFWCFDFVINTTESMPLGIYQILNEHPVKGDIVIFKIPQKQVRLLKKIVAAGGDTVVINNDGMFVDGIKIKNSDIQKFDSKNNSLKFVTVNKILSYNEILVAGEHKKSYDSRYFGIIDTKKIKIQKVKKILTWEVCNG